MKLALETGSRDCLPHPTLQLRQSKVPSMLRQLSRSLSAVSLILLVYLTDFVQAARFQSVSDGPAMSVRSGSKSGIQKTSEDSVTAGTLGDLLNQLSSMTGDEDPKEEEQMRNMMTEKARSVIFNHAALGLSDVEAILEGRFDSFHPSTMPNVTLGQDLFASGNVLPVADVNGDGQITVDDLLATFFHAGSLESYFHSIEQHDQMPLAKGQKKQVIKHQTPTLHHTIKKITSHRGWGIQDSRFCQPIEDLDDNSPFKDYTTFVKTMREALMTSDSA